MMQTHAQTAHALATTPLAAHVAHARPSHNSAITLGPPG